ncbi:MAG: dicarboxylate/amino acid:cation symporter, partial [Candidatus Electrothrix sp. AR3]|nr:dicarboxylate/amino acid:cation symporter [Candidatus Electrothrix sp. AR3]
MQKKKSHLTFYILGAIILAIVFSLILPHMAMKFHIGGEVFLKLLKMMVVPLVVSSVMSGILGLGDIRKLGRPGGTAVVYYLLTTVMAVFIGLLVVNIIQPGVGSVDQQTLNEIAAQSENISHKDVNIWTILNNLVLMLFTDNLFSSAA